MNHGGQCPLHRELCAAIPREESRWRLILLYRTSQPGADGEEVALPIALVNHVGCPLLTEKTKGKKGTLFLFKVTLFLSSVQQSIITQTFFLTNKHFKS